jgi:WD40 repeat protein
MGSITVEKKATLTGQKDSIYALSSSQYSNIFFSAGGDGIVVSWDLEDPQNGQVIAQVPNSVYALCYDLERDQLIIGHNFDGIHIVNWQQKKEVASLKFTDQAIFTLEVKGKDIIAGTGDGELLVIDAQDLVIKNRIKKTEKSLRCLAINKNSNELAAGYSDNMIRLFDLNDYNIKHEWKAHDNSVFGLEYSPNDQVLISTSRDARFKAWDVKNNYKLIESVIGHMYTINDISFSPDGKHFVTCSMDKTLKVWDAKELKLLKVIDKARHAGHGTSVNKVFWSTYNNQIISCSDDRTISVWNLSFNNE